MLQFINVIFNYFNILNIYFHSFSPSGFYNAIGQALHLLIIEELCFYTFPLACHREGGSEQIFWEYILVGITCSTVCVHLLPLKVFMSIKIFHNYDYKINRNIKGTIHSRVQYAHCSLVCLSVKHAMLKCIKLNS